MHLYSLNNHPSISLLKLLSGPLSVSNQFHVDCAKENVRAGYKATLLCSVSEQRIDNADNIYAVLASGPFY